MELGRGMRTCVLHLAAVTTLAAARILVRLLGLQRTLVVLAGRSVGRPRDPEGARVVRAVRRAGSLVPGATCLVQSLAVAALLNRMGRPCDLVLGCRRRDDGWVAHAWVEVDGERLEPVVGGVHHELARCRSTQGWRLLAARGRAEPDPA